MKWSGNAVRRTGAVASVIASLLFAGCAGTYDRGYTSASYASSDGSIGVSYFYDSLAPYGRWIEYSSYGWCWAPYQPSPYWRPYWDGYWALTEYGWTWISDEPWGWATYHYGRWVFDPPWGWIWVPGTVWAPAWVAWHSSDSWVGWAPLPPEARWEVSVGLRFTDRIPDSHWCFVEPRHLSDRRLRTKIVSVSRNVTLLRETRDATRFDSLHGRPVNRGVDASALEKQTGRAVKRLTTVDVSAPKGIRPDARHELRVFRPTFRAGEPDAAPPPATRESSAKQLEKERRELEAYLAKERERMERRHAQELRPPARTRSVEELRQRQAAEREALEKHAAQQRQVLEERARGQKAKPGRGSPPSEKDRGGKPGRGGG
jgi:hypothetical protein